MEETKLSDEYLYWKCRECNQRNTGYKWCQPCNSKRFQQNFKNWTSGNYDVDEFIQRIQLKAKSKYEVLEWIEYDRFENVEYLAKGGFGTVFKAIWKDGFIEEWDYENNQWRYQYDKEVALKYLHNSQDITIEFLREVESYTLIHKNVESSIVRCYGITKDPETNNFMIVMKFINGSLRQHLNNKFSSMSWKNRLHSLVNTARGLNQIHSSGLIHHDFHCGNILGDSSYCSVITDLGLSQPANVKSSQNDDKEIYGVLPYMAPEVLRGKEYTQASDIYAFGIVAYEVCTGFPPYHDVAHDELLAIEICQGLRPKVNYKIPQSILDIIKQCWDVDPLKRPEAEELLGLLYKLFADSDKEVINKQIKEADEINEKLSSSPSPLLSTGTLSYVTHPQAVYTSRLLDFNNLPEPKNANNNDDSLEMLRI